MHWRQPGQKIVERRVAPRASLVRKPFEPQLHAVEERVPPRRDDSIPSVGNHPAHQVRKESFAGDVRRGRVALVPEPVQPRSHRAVCHGVESRERIAADDPRQVVPVQFPARRRESLKARPVAARGTGGIAGRAQGTRAFKRDDRRIGPRGVGAIEKGKRRIERAMRRRCRAQISSAPASACGCATSRANAAIWSSRSVRSPPGRVSEISRSRAGRRS